MHYERQSLHLPLSILAAAFSGDGLTAVDMTPTIYKFSTDAQLLSHNSIGGIDPLSYRYTKALTLYDNAHYALLCDSQNSKALLVDLKSKKIPLQIKMQKSPKFALFSSNGLYAMVANAVGRVVLYSMETFELLDEFAFPDELANASFSADGSKLVVTTLDRGVFLYDIETKTIEKIAQLKEIAELVSISADGNIILLFTREGRVHRYSIATQELYSAEPLYEWATTMAHSSNSRIVIVGTRSSQLFIYNVQRGEILGKLSFDFWGISSLCVDESRLFVGFCDGNGVILDASEQIREAKELLEGQNIAQLCVTVAESALIFLDKEFCLRVIQEYKQILHFKPEGTDERAGYDALVSLILGEQTLQRELLKELYASEELYTFTESLEQGKSKEACELAYHTPLLRQLKELTAVRTKCYEQKERELKMLEKNPHEFKEYLESAQESCMQCEYGVATLSLDLIEAYKKLKKSAQAMSYATLFEIVNHYPIFRQTRVFARMMHYGESLIDKTLIMLGANKTEEALKYATKLSLMKPFAKTGDDFKKQISLYVTFEKACQSQNIAQICSVVKEQPSLRATQLFKKQVANYNEYEKPAIALAKKGDVSATMKHMSRYAEVEYFAQRIDNLKRLALLYEIKNYAPLGEERELLEAYYKCFGWDEHYARVSAFFEIETTEEPKREEIDPECYKKETFLKGERNKRKDHFKAAGVSK